MTTFSQLVDSLIQEHTRPDLRATIESYVNLTLRELHSSPSTGGAVLYAQNLKEAQVTADEVQGFTWEIPRPQVFQRINAVRFDSFGSGQDAFAIERNPNSMRLDHMRPKYFYRAGQQYSFVNYGGVGAKISLAWYEVTPRLKYYPLVARPCSWDIETQTFSYLSGYDTGDVGRQAARDLCTNWILDRWEDLVAQGTRAKIFTRLADDVRSRLNYSLYKQMQPDIVSAETFAGGVI